MKVQKVSPTLYDVAARSGVSTATVSRCLNFPDHVAEPTRLKVMKAIEDLGYSPNFGAKVMAARRTNTIGAIIPTMENAIFARGLQAFQDALREKGYTLLVASSSYRADQEEEMIRALVARGADGLLLIGHARRQEIYDFLDAQGIPALVVWAHDTTESQASVGFDNHQAMAELTRYAISLGHRRLALMTAPIAANDRAMARRLGVLDAMAEIGLPAKDLIEIETPYGIEHGARAFETLMTGNTAPTVILCGNDVLAVGALRRAREMGIDVPGDVSITGFDDIELAQVAVPALTTVHVPHREMGKRAAQMLIARLQGEGVLHTVELSAELKIRESLGPPPS